MIRNAQPDDIVFLTICNHPIDFPDHVTMRASVVRLGHTEPIHEQVAGLYADLAEARRDVPSHAIKFRRHDADDPVIVESWML